MVLDKGFTAFVTQRAKALRDNWRVGRRVLLEQFGDGGLERVKLARTIAARGRRRRSFEVFDDRAPADVQVGGDLAQRLLLDTVQAMNGVDLIRVEHRRDSFMGRKVSTSQSSVVCKKRQIGRLMRKCFQNPQLRRSQGVVCKIVQSCAQQPNCSRAAL